MAEQKQLEDKIWQLERQVEKQKNTIETLRTIMVRSMVVLKYLLRIGALLGCWFWFGPKATYWLAGFIVLVGLTQLTIDKVQQAVHPDTNLSEWNID